MNENEIYDVLGLKAPEQPSAAENQEPAALAEDQPTAESAAAENGAEQTGGGADEGTPERPKEQEPAEPAAEKKEQTREERARHAAERRKAETEEAVRLAREEERARAERELIETLKEAGLAEGRELKTRADVEQYLRERAKAALDEKLENGTAKAEDFEKLMQQRQAAETRRLREEQERQQFLQSIEGEMAEVRKIRPDIKTIADFGKLDKAKDFYDLVMQGESYLGAVKKLYGEAQEQQRQQMQRQQIVNELNGLSHLQGAGKSSGVSTEPALSPEELAAYRTLNPKASESDIRAHWNGYRKKTGR